MKDELISIETKETPEIGGKIAECNALAEQVQGSLTRAWQTAAVLGYQLCEIKQQVGHGQFGKLFTSKGKANLNHGLNFSIQMANRYMDLFKKCAAAAGKIGQKEALRTMMGDVSKLRITNYELRIGEESAAEAAEKEDKLSNLLTSLAPQATSMRQALFAFMEEDEEEPAKEAPRFFRKNDKGRPAKKALTPAEVDTIGKLASEQMEAYVQGIDGLYDKLPLIDAGVRDHAIATLEKTAKTLKELR